MVLQKNSIEMQLAITSPSSVASMLIEQSAKLPIATGLPPANIYLNDTRALGYAYGFSEQASRHANREHHKVIGQIYIEKVFMSLLKKESKAKSLLMLAGLQLDDRPFQKGYNLGSTDLNDWVFCRGRTQPSGMVELYQ